MVERFFESIDNCRDLCARSKRCLFSTIGFQVLLCTRGTLPNNNANYRRGLNLIRHVICCGEILQFMWKIMLVQYGVRNFRSVQVDVKLNIDNLWRDMLWKGTKISSEIAHGPSHFRSWCIRNFIFFIQISRVREC